jgi:hypothetical protein
MTRRLPTWMRWLCRGIMVTAWLLSLQAAAQSVETVLSPGPLIANHAKWEDSCKHCHVRFDRPAQDQLCADCHKDIGRDLVQHTGMHGRMKRQPCRVCHTDHRGRDMRIAEFDKRSFDHQQTDYSLRAKHRETDCGKCHLPRQKYSAAPHECSACHRKDDVHKGSLGNPCENCHDERSWREARVDHGVTRFALTGAHIKARCETCHKSRDYKDAPQTCLGCHRKEDKHKNQFGEKCESCHNAQRWPQITFHHNVDTRYPLLAKHRDVRCATCHSGVLYREKTGTACADCHRKDDKHKGSLGQDCVRCHSERGWKEAVRFEHDRTSFPLLGRHGKTACKDCHNSLVYKEAPSTCIGCHRKDDKHEASLGEPCADCHTAQDWKTPNFDHARTRFPLRDAHALAKVACTACHRDLRSFRDIPKACVDCHRRDDRHEGQLGADCAACHGELRWVGMRFDHSAARFTLAGAHLPVPCKSCHLSPRYRDAPRDCASCHEKADVHKRSLSAACESCHNVRDWRLWRFDHDKTEYRLVSAHAKVRCQNCHSAPAPAGQKIAPAPRQCMACHTNDDAHDRSFGSRCEQCHQPTRWPQIFNRPGLSLPRGGLQ